MVAERVLFDTEFEAFTISAFSSGAEAGSPAALWSDRSISSTLDGAVSIEGDTLLVDAFPRETRVVVSPLERMVEAAGATGEFSDHCTVMREGIQFTVDPMSFSTSNTSLRGTPVPPSRSATGFDWQWVNKDRVSPTGVRAEVPDVVGTTPENVSTPEGRTQTNLNAWYQQIWDSDFRVGRVEIGYHPGGQPNPAIPQVLAAHCEWDVKVSSNADTNSESSTLNDDVTLNAVPVWDLAEGETAPWLTVDGKKAQVSIHGRAYHTTTQPVKGNDIPADAQLIGETTLTFNGPGTQTGSIAKPENLDGGYITWVWTVDRSEQGDWADYMDNEAASTNYGEDANTVNVPEKPKPAPVRNTTQPSTAPARSNAETPAAPVRASVAPLAECASLKITACSSAAAVD